MKVSPSSEDATITVELIGAKYSKSPITLDEDKNFVFRISNKDSQSIKITSIVNDNAVSKTYSLNGLTLKTE